MTHTRRDDLISVSEATRIARVSAVTLYALVKRGKIPSEHHQGRMAIPRPALQDYMNWRKGREVSQAGDNHQYNFFQRAATPAVVRDRFAGMEEQIQAELLACTLQTEAALRGVEVAEQQLAAAMAKEDEFRSALAKVAELRAHYAAAPLE